MEKEFHHTKLNAFANSIRNILHYTKQKFKDVSHDFVIDPNENIKTTHPHDGFALYKEGDRSLNQSLAIAKYVARGTSLIPDDPWEQAVIENIVYTIHEYWSKVVAYILEKDINKKRAMKQKLIEETIDYYFLKFEQHLKENGGFFIGKLTWVEFVLCGLVEASDLFFGIELAKRYPMVAAVVDIIRNLPGVKEHIATRGPNESQKLE
ncbi:unnamed protein product [Arctia plantaginis]|uniref:glutathione transferase n=1 Tax=Arctia plantaginis TaxID=874455 RepID=A0A8S1AZU0_ARCPL|nr:unnamed protein product [Arctia plantaginis]